MKVTCSAIINKPKVTVQIGKFYKHNLDGTILLGIYYSGKELTHSVGLVCLNNLERTWGPLTEPISFVEELPAGTVVTLTSE